jgi:hypothetical protein
MSIPPISPDQLPISRHILRLFERMRVIEARLSVLEHRRQGRSAKPVEADPLARDRALCDRIQPRTASRDPSAREAVKII